MRELVREEAREQAAAPRDEREEEAREGSKRGKGERGRERSEAFEGPEADEEGVGADPIGAAVVDHDELSSVVGYAASGEGERERRIVRDEEERHPRRAPFEPRAAAATERAALVVEQREHHAPAGRPA